MSTKDKASVIPLHVGMILDGNRRWAIARGLAPWRGHAKGEDTLHVMTKAVFESGVKCLSVYAFSTENWKRSEKEVGYLMRHVGLALKKYIREVMEENIRIIFLGQRDGLSKSVLKAIDNAVAKTASNTRATLAICFNYGGLQELADAAKGLIRSGIDEAEVTPERMAGHLYHPEVPPIDLLIRTGGERRLSNFMLWRAAYAELYFTPVLWPDFSKADWQAALDEYASRQRRFGS
jgi:undecaprenyl diphosphate synthase